VRNACVARLLEILSCRFFLGLVDTLLLECLGFVVTKQPVGRLCYV